MTTTYDELRRAEERAEQLFDECVRRNLVVAGKTERALSAEVFELARDLFGVTRHWHKRIVRAGPNTLLPYDENPPDRLLADDDVVYFDFGPIFGDWEADVGRTYVLGSDPRKLALARDVAHAWDLGVARYRDEPALTGAQLYAYVSELARERGWQFGHVHAGHLVGRFPHERIDGDAGYIRPENRSPLRGVLASGEPRHWILEIHFVDRAGGFGGFHEGLLGPP